MDVHKQHKKQLPDLNNAKFTAVKIDLTRLTNRRKYQAVVISDKTTGLEIKQMVIHKIGMDQRQIPLVELILNDWNTLVNTNCELEDTDRRMMIVDDLECPLLKCDISNDKLPKLDLIWKNDEGELVQEIKGIKLDHGRTVLENQSHFLSGSETIAGLRNGSTLPGHGKELRFQEQGMRNVECGSYPAHINECLIHYEPYADMTEKEHLEKSRESRSFSSTSSDSVLSNLIKNITINNYRSEKLFPGGVGNGEHDETSAFRSFGPASGQKNLSVESLAVKEQRETQFSSLPTIEHMVENPSDNPLTSCHHPASTSLPCISTSNHPTAGRSGRRILPEVSIPEEIVEEKRHLLSKQLEKKLLKVASIKRKQHSVVNHSKKKGRSRGERRISGNDSDDCVSVTSMEVATIMAEAGPMVPVESDYEDPGNRNDSEGENIPNVQNFSSLFQTIPLGFSGDSGTEGTLDGSSEEENTKRNKKIKNVDSKTKTNTHNLSSKLNGELEKSRSNHRHKNNNNNNKSHHTKYSQQQQISSPVFSSSHSKRRIQNSEKKLTLFKLLLTEKYHLCLVVIKRSRNFKKRFPFEVFNDVIYLDNVTKTGSQDVIPKEKFTVIVVGDVSDDLSLYCVEKSVEVGDILIEVNGTRVLNQSAVELARLCDIDTSSKYFQIVLARQILNFETDF